MTINDIKIPLELQDNSFIKSLHNYCTSSTNNQTKPLTQKQLYKLKDILNIEESDLDSIITQKVKVYYEYFYRADYHGDYLCDYKKVYNISENILEDKIQDLSARQYGQEVYTNKYKFIEEIEIPNCNNILYFCENLYSDYKFIIDKLKRNKFRKIKTKNDAIRCLQQILNFEVDEIDSILLDRVLGRYKIY